MGSKRVSPRNGLTVLELMVSLGIVGLIAAMVLPALSAAREAARRIQCVDHLRELGIALHNHHSSLNRLPVGWAFDPSQRSAYGWAVPLLPYLGETPLSDQIDRRVSVDSPTHSIARGTSLSTMRCPSDIAEPFFLLFEESDDSPAILPLASFRNTRPVILLELPTANYVGVFGTLDPDISIPAPQGDGAFLENRRVRFSDFQRGVSNALVIGERTMAQVPSTWLGVSLIGEDAAARLVGAALQGINNPLADECDFSSRHPGGANFLWGDGRVTFLSDEIDLDQYHRSAKR